MNTRQYHFIDLAKPEASRPRMSVMFKRVCKLCRYVIRTQNYGSAVSRLHNYAWPEQAAFFHVMFDNVPKSQINRVVSLFEEFVVDMNWVYMFFLLQAKRGMYERFGMSEQVAEVNAAIHKVLAGRPVKSPPSF